jgi:hypothetical protein
MSINSDINIQAIKYWLITYGTGWVVCGGAYHRMLPNDMNAVRLQIGGLLITEMENHAKGDVCKLSPYAMYLIESEVVDD